MKRFRRAGLHAVAAPWFVALLVFAALRPAAAAEGAHRHGVARLDVAVDAQTLVIEFEAPLDSLLGFEHRPRTAAQKQAAAAVLARMNDGAALFVPDQAAGCSATKTQVDAPVLQSPSPADGRDDEHADLDARFEFRCEQPDKLGSVQVGLFDAFKRIRRIEAQVAGAKGQSKQTLTPQARTLKLAR